MSTQNLKNHTRRDPKFLSLAVLLLICFIASIVHVLQEPTRANMLLVPVTFALLFLAGVVRGYAVKMQDRVIRLEELTRMRVLGVDATGLSLSQIIGLRFASDEELPALTARARAENLTCKQIKESVVDWRADDFRV